MKKRHIFWPVIFLASLSFYLFYMHPLFTHPQQIETDLYFGMSKKDGGHVTENEFEHFVNAEILPAFKDGFTVESANGVWLSSHSRKIVRENTKIVILVHKDDPKIDETIKKICADYDHKHEQEAVLSVRKPVDIRLS